MERQQSQVSWKAVSLGDHEPAAVVLHLAANPALPLLQADLHPGRGRVLLDIRHGLGQLPEQHRAVLIRQLVRKLEIGFDLGSGQRAQHPDALLDRLQEAPRDLERGRPDLEQEAA